MQNSNTYDYGNVVDFRRVPKRVIEGDYSAPRTDFAPPETIIEERSQKNFNIYNGVFNETLHKIFNSTTATQFTLSYQRLFAEKFKTPLTVKKNILSESYLFRQELQEKIVNLYELQLKSNETLYIQYPLYKDNIQ